MKNIFTLESGVISSTPSTRKFFEEVKEFYLTIRTKGDRQYVCCQDTRDISNAWYSSEVVELVDQHNGYIKIKTRHTVLQVWSDTYYSKMERILKLVTNWREYRWTYYLGKDVFQIIADRQVKMEYKDYLSCGPFYEIWDCNKKSVLYDLHFQTESQDTAHEILRILIMAEIFCEDCGFELHCGDLPEGLDETSITLKNNKKGVVFSLLIRRGRLYLTFNNGATVISVDKNQTVDDEVERFLRCEKLFPNKK